MEDHTPTEMPAELVSETECTASEEPETKTPFLPNATCEAKEESDEVSCKPIQTNTTCTTTQVNRDVQVSPSSLRRHEGVLQPAPATQQISFGEFHPDGGWGWIVCAAAFIVNFLCHGYHLSFGLVYMEIIDTYKVDRMQLAWVATMSYGVTLMLAPLMVAICRRKSIRLYAVIGGLVCTLGCLFMSFSKEIHQFFISHGFIESMGTTVTLATANIVIGRYYKEKREIAEALVLAGSGIGAALLSVFIRETLQDKTIHEGEPPDSPEEARAIAWNHAMQSLTGLMIPSSLAGLFYRSASLYHPRRRVIMHLRSQKKLKRDRDLDKPAYFDFSALKMRSMQCLYLGVSIIILGLHVPYVLLAQCAIDDGVPPAQAAVIAVFLGLAFATGVLLHAFFVVKTMPGCVVSRQYLCQFSAFLSGLFTLLLNIAEGYKGYALYAWGYGIFSGGFYYMVKVYTYELTTSKLMETAWGYMMFVWSIPILVGTPFAVYLNRKFKSDAPKAGLTMAGISMIVGSLFLFIMNWAGKHKSNEEVLKASAQAHDFRAVVNTAELADLDFSDDCSTKPVRNLVVKSSSDGKINQDRTSVFPNHKHAKHKKHLQQILTQISEERENNFPFEKMTPMSPTSKVTEFLMGTSQNDSNSGETLPDLESERGKEGSLGDDDENTVPLGQIVERCLHSGRSIDLVGGSGGASSAGSDALRDQITLNQDHIPAINLELEHRQRMMRKSLSREKEIEADSAMCDSTETVVIEKHTRPFEITTSV